MGFFRREYWSGVPFPSPWYLPDPEIEPASPVSLTLQVYSLFAEPILFSLILVLSYSALFAMLCGLWDLSFPTRDETHALGSENSPNP